MKVGGWFLSEKLDGTRCFWDGGVSRDKPTETVPWAGIIDPKTGDRKKKIKPLATGLWSRYGNPIMAPDSFLNLLPACPLDGELFAGRGNFQRCRSIVSGDAPDERWNEIDFAVYAGPSAQDVFSDGMIKNANMICEIKYDECKSYIQANALEGSFFPSAEMYNFESELAFIASMIEEAGDRVYLHKQVKLPKDNVEAAAEVERRMVEILDLGGEGVMLRDPGSFYRPKRVAKLLKYKPFEDDEAKVVGFITGKEGKQGNVLGKMGAMIVEFKGQQFEIGSGFSFEDRELLDEDRDAAVAAPGTHLAINRTKHFEVGDMVTFKYREFSDDGIPKEARYWRKYG